MKKLVSILTLVAAIALTGCGSTPKTPARIAHTAAATTIDTADAAISAWADYVVQQRQEIARLKASPSEEDKGRGLGLAHELLVKEGQVSSAYYQYQDAAKAAIGIGATTAGDGEVAAKVAAASAQLIALVTQLTVR